MHMDRKSFAIGSAVAITSAVAYYATKKYVEGPPTVNIQLKEKKIHMED